MSDQKVKIAFLINALEYGGAQRVFVDDANMFARRGIKVLLCTLYPDKGTDPFVGELDSSIERVVLNSRGPFDLRAVIRARCIFQNAGVTVLVTTLNDANIIGRWIALTSLGRIRLIRREANTIERKPRWQWILDLFLDIYVYRIIAVSDAIRAEYLQRAPWRRNKIVVLHNSIMQVPTIDRSQHIIPHIITVGRMHEQKDHATLISVLGILAREGHAFTACIIGDGPLFEKITQQLRDEGITDRVATPGTLLHPRVLAEYEHADIFAFSSRWEGSPNVVLEAMAYGLPVVATTVGGTQEIIEDGVSGILVPPQAPVIFAEALARLVRDRSARMAMGTRAHARAASFAPESRFQKLYNLCASL